MKAQRKKKKRYEGGNAMANQFWQIMLESGPNSTEGWCLRLRRIGRHVEHAAEEDLLFTWPADAELHADSLIMHAWELVPEPNRVEEIRLHGDLSKLLTERHERLLGIIERIVWAAFGPLHTQKLTRARLVECTTRLTRAILPCIDEVELRRRFCADKKEEKETEGHG